TIEFYQACAADAPGRIAAIDAGAAPNEFSARHQRGSGRSCGALADQRVASARCTRISSRLRQACGQWKESCRSPLAGTWTVRCRVLPCASAATVYFPAGSFTNMMGPSETALSISLPDGCLMVTRTAARNSLSLAAENT